jgi:hypothetical protein
MTTDGSAWILALETLIPQPYSSLFGHSICAKIHLEPCLLPHFLDHL